MPAISRSRASAARKAGSAEAHQVRLRMLIGLCHRRWSLPILAELQKEIRPGGGGGAKFVTLANRLSLSRETLRDTLDDLIHRDYLMRNPGVGHPMRPEYMLTEDGHAAAPHATAVMRAIRAGGIEDVALRKWSLPVLLSIASGMRRFGQLKAMLPGVSSRALTLALKELEAEGLVRRSVTHEYPPGVSYQLLGAARRITRLLERFSPMSF